jgi:hypothetical protein
MSALDRKALLKKAKRGFCGYPVVTVAFYGPDDQRATKVAVSLVRAAAAEPDILERWFSEDDARYDGAIARRVLAFVQEHAARTVVLADRILGCPHEQGIDYTEEWCPQCAFWMGRDRFTGEPIH